MEQSEAKDLNKELSKEIGRRVKSIRTLLGINQDYISKRTGISKNTITAIEGGYYNTSVRYLNAILDAMGYELVFQPKAVSPDHHTV